ncbi:MAG: Eco57I restriction-modification methylase domain-containing protein [Muribaculaceae bacterium]
MIFESALKAKLIYVFRINNEEHHGCLKIGETSVPDGYNVLELAPNSHVLNEAAKRRIKQYTKTDYYELLYTEGTAFSSGGTIKSFNDKAVHEVLIRSGIKRHESENWGVEWFETDLSTAINAIKAVKEGRKSLHTTEITEGQNPIIFRKEQRDAIEKTKKQFKKSNQMLWNAKMRFGKTLSALKVAKDMDFIRTLILTHRPVVDRGWFEDFCKIFYDSPGFAYGSKNKGDSHASLEARAKQGRCQYVYFASMQDLRGSETVGGKFDKNNEIFSTSWDFIIIDEAHEGTQTELGQSVIKELTKQTTKVLALSGTPFNLFDDYNDDELYTWDYVMEQRAKVQWDLEHFGDHNPYAGLPTMNIYTYDLGRLLHDYIDEDVAFNFREFFRVNDLGEFVHNKDVAAFLDLLCKKDSQSAYPFSEEAYRDIFRHTLWMVPGVKSALAIQRMLEKHTVFQHFKVVNVAGDGDEDEESKDALEAVEKAIGTDPDATRTITLSCGRLTTGVSVKAWTAVLMLTGSFNTSAATYMQTIFRVQTPATINGRVKEQCYVFDFAPDRTLKVIAETAKISTKAGKTSGDDRRAIGEFLNFCPVISINGSKMHSFNVNDMLQQLKKVYIERVVNNGFEDGYLYNDELMKLDSLALKEFEDLKKTIGQTKAMPKTNSVDVNNQGLTNEEYEEKESLEKKKKRELTEDEKKRLEELKAKKKNRDTAISILRGISIRMPLMIYGADIDDEKEEITIDNFTALIDSPSWEEFMPRGVTKQKFNAFRKYYDRDIFAAAAKRIRNMVRSADNLSIEQRIERITQIFATFRNPDKETVLTPWRVVNMHMSDTIGGYTFLDTNFDEKKTLDDPRFVDRGKVTAEVFNPDTRILEINSKTGLYPLYVAYSTYRSRLASLKKSPESVEEEWEVWREVVAENIFVICKTPMAKSITKRTLVGFRSIKVNTRYFEDLINQIKNKPNNFIEKVAKGKSFWKAINNDNMKFNAVVGNPPYQIVNKGDGNGADPVYHSFIDIARRISNISTLIHPARFLFNAGKTPKDWNLKMLNETNFKVVDYWANSNKVFPNVDVKGGIAVTMSILNENFGKIGLFSPFKEVLSIISKVKTQNHPSFSELVYPRDLYKLTEKLYEENPSFEGRQSAGHKYDIGSSIFDIFPEIFWETKPKTGNYIGIYGLNGHTRVTRWVKREYIKLPNNIDFYKVLIPKSNGSGTLGEVLSTPVIGVPVIGHTLTFLSIGRFEKSSYAEACLKYIRTRFARLLLGSLKVTQDNPRDTWLNVPLQDFSENSDIDWSKSVAEIDRQLYAKYGLSEEEIAFIESMIKPM